MPTSSLPRPKEKAASLPALLHPPPTMRLSRARLLEMSSLRKTPHVQFAETFGEMPQRLPIMLLRTSMTSACRNCWTPHAASHGLFTWDLVARSRLDLACVDSRSSPYCHRRSSHHDSLPPATRFMRFVARSELDQDHRLRHRKALCSSDQGPLPQQIHGMIGFSSVQ